MSDNPFLSLLFPEIEWTPPEPLAPRSDDNALPSGVLNKMMHYMGQTANWSTVAYGASNIKTVEQTVQTASTAAAARANLRHC